MAPDEHIAHHKPAPQQVFSIFQDPCSRFFSHQGFFVGPDPVSLFSSTRVLVRWASERFSKLAGKWITAKPSKCFGTWSAGVEVGWTGRQCLLKG